MKHTPEQLALQHTFAVCQGHADALQDALQDDMGARLVPAVLKALGEDVAPMSALDRFGRLEQLGWLPSADEWMALRQVRNQFAHDYPDSPAERFERLQAATQAARALLAVMAQFQSQNSL